MTASGCTLFDTAIGRCGVAWRGAAVVAVQLPEQDDARTLRRLHRGAPGAVEQEPPEGIRAVIAAVVALLDGQPVDLAWVAVDLVGVPDFHRRAYDVIRAVAPGRTTTYGEVATMLGDPAAARAVGVAMGANPVPIIVPCHRVVSADGRLGGFSAPGGTATKRRILAIEGATPPALFDL
jgi:methylated-DNA-[protein]-cysteine S-methyltransferase